VRRAVRWLRGHGEELGLATERVGAWGASAGAHLAMMLAFGPEAEPEPGLAAVVGLFGTYELRERAAQARMHPDAELPEFIRAAGIPWPIRPSFEAMLLGVQDVAEAPQLAEAASPVAHAHGDGPPVLLIHGETDGLVSADQSRWMYEAIRGAGGPATLMMVADANHEDERFDRPEIVAATAAFLRAALA
jgi:acetyl esterase/lipase